MVSYPIASFGTTALGAAEQNGKTVDPINDLQTRLAAVETSEQFAYKTADETVTASTTLQDDDHLLFTVAASGVYTFEAFLMVTHSTDAADVKIAFAYPTGATASFSQAAANNAALTTSGTSGSGEYIARQAQASPVSSTTPLAGSTSLVGVLVRGMVVMSTTGGSLKLQWAQNTATGTTTIKAQSWMTVTKRA